MSSPIHQYAISLVVSVPIRRDPGILKNVLVRNRGDLNNQNSMWQNLRF